MGDRADKDQDALEGWTKEDKYNLLIALKSCRPYTIMNLKIFIPNKTSEEITAAISYYKGKAKKHKALAQETKFAKMTKLRPDSQVPLASWASLLTDSFSFDDLQTDTVTAIRLIGDVEDIPSPFHTQGIDFRKVYHQIANAMEGKGLLGNKYINAILKKCVVDTAFTSRSYIKNGTLRMLLGSIDLSQNVSRTGFPSHSDNTELALLRQLALQKAYNPLNIPEQYFKPSAPIGTVANTP